MDVDTITALLAGLGGQIATGINQALVNGNNAGREGVGPPGRPPDFSDRHRPDTAAQILKSQQSAFDHVMDNRADPDSQTITAFTAQHSSGNRGGYDDAKLRFGGFNLFNGWRSSDLPTAIAQRHPVRAARLHS